MTHFDSAERAAVRIRTALTGGCSRKPHSSTSLISPQCLMTAIFMPVYLTKMTSVHPCWKKKRVCLRA